MHTREVCRGQTDSIFVIPVSETHSTATAAVETEFVREWPGSNVAAMNMRGADRESGVWRGLWTCDGHGWRTKRPVERRACIEAEYEIIIAPIASSVSVPMMTQWGVVE